MKISVVPAVLAVTLFAVSSSVFAQYFDPNAYTVRYKTNLRTYSLYPYTHSIGPRYDPYWSYNSSYFPETYQGDGSYYGLGYSGNAGREWYGTYWYW